MDTTGREQRFQRGVVVGLNEFTKKEPVIPLGGADLISGELLIPGA